MQLSNKKPTTVPTQVARPSGTPLRSQAGQALVELAFIVPVLLLLTLGVIEGFTKVIYPEASNIVVFVIMALVLILRPAGLFGRE